jgi:teichuronic acid exporter
MFAPFMNTAASGMGRADVSAKQVLIAALVMPIAFLIGSQWGLVGLALSWVIAFPVVFAAAILLFVPIVGLRPRDLLGAMAPTVLACAGMYLAVTAARVLLGSAMDDAVRMTALILTGMVAYAALTAIFNRNGFTEVIHTLKG